jgi:hypothetical protein
MAEQSTKNTKGKKKFLRDTKFGALLKEKAPKLVSIIGDVLPNAGALGIIKRT